MSDIIEKLGITQGDWEAVENVVDYESGGECHQRIDGIDICYNDDGECICDNVYIEKDALLIAAAPEMLKALIGSVFEIDRFDVPEVEILRDVVEKATGKSWAEIKELL